MKDRLVPSTPLGEAAGSSFPAIYTNLGHLPQQCIGVIVSYSLILCLHWLCICQVWTEKNGFWFVARKEILKQIYYAGEDTQSGGRPFCAPVEDLGLKLWGQACRLEAQWVWWHTAAREFVMLGPSHRSLVHWLLWQCGTWHRLSQENLSNC